MKNKTLLSLLVLSLTGPMDIAAKGKIEFDEIKDSIWTLTQNASQSRLRGDGQVLTYVWRCFSYLYCKTRPRVGYFSIIDSRNLEYLIKGDQIQLLESKFSDRVLKVKLLSGIRKNKNYYIITDDLLKTSLNWRKPMKQASYLILSILIITGCAYSSQRRMWWIVQLLKEHNQ